MQHDSAQLARDPRMQVVYHPVERLKPDPKNPRRHERKQIRKIADSIAAFGFNVPVLVDDGLRVIAGHGRLLACRLLGIAEVPTISLEHLSEAQARAFMIADNRLTEIAEWDDRLLGQQLRELAELDLEFSLEVTGFDLPEIDLLIEGASGTAADDPDDEPVPLPSGPPVKAGGYLDHGLAPAALRQRARGAMLWRAAGRGSGRDGVHRPPYNVPVDGHVGGLGRIRHREFAMAAGEMDEAQFTGFLTRVLGHLAAFSQNGSLHFICMDWRHMGELLAAGRQAYTELKNLCVWAKDNAGMGSLYRSQHELVFVFKHGREPHRNNVQLGRYGRNRSNVWKYPGANSFSRGSEGNLLALHPTVKPVAMVADALRDCCGRGEIVLDPFLGSGTTLIAAERTGRICHGLELDPLYVDTAVRRWQTLTGGRAQEAGTGRRFEDHARDIGEAA